MSIKKIRNFAALAAIMAKGGAHVKTHKAKRQQDKQSLKKTLRADSFGSFLLCRNYHSATMA